MPKKIAVLIPFVRPEMVYRVAKFARESAGIPWTDFEVILAEDEHRIGHTKFFHWMLGQTDAEMIAFVADDCIPGQDYLKHAVKAMEKFDDGWGVIGFNDLTGRLGFATHWLAHRNMMAHLGGELLHTGYLHCCCDLELAERAAAMGRFDICKEAVVYHDHPLVVQDPTYTVDDDETYSRVYSKDYLEHDRELLKKRRASFWTYRKEEK